MRIKVKRTFVSLVLVGVLTFVFYLHSQVKEPQNERMIADYAHGADDKLKTTTKNMPRLGLLHKPKASPASVGEAPPELHAHAGSECPKLMLPVNVEDKQSFQMVNAKTDLYVFSAFYDDVGQPAILRIIGLNVRYGSGSVLCQAWFEGRPNSLSVITGSVQRLPEDHGLRYGAVYIKCPLRDGQKPYAVSVVKDSCQEPINLLKVIYSERSANFTVCVTPFNFRYSRAYELVEWIEMNRMLGADYFTFYNHSTGVNVDSVLKLYVSQGLVNVVQWHLPMAVDHWPPGGKSEVHYFAQLASLNDCVYRNLHRSKYLVYEDLDEVIMPRQARNWTAFLSTRLKENSRFGVFIIRCNFFRKDWPLLKTDFKGKDIAEKFRSIFLFTTTKEQNVFGYNQRSKFITDPRKVEIVGIHNIWVARSNTLIDRVPDSQGLLHHYRNWEKPNEKIPRTTDMYMHTFADTLISRLELIWSQLGNVRLDIPLSEYPSPV
ncbi:uncharacterized protein LOC121388038 [Gigantopelta aegis]|uniref:uncharacterized protein LOC121388038 n=1 Tax=Gigantopelta aegis TaxID=1735272 RepID=UPI001B889272|nr:uncharacterized protein LOC121388038 [Gigantopelta aegis]